MLVANTLWATARLQGCGSTQLTTLRARLASAVEATANDMNQRYLANIAWSVAKLAITDTNSEVLLSVLPRVVSLMPATI